jgi:hypothetical protein
MGELRVTSWEDYIQDHPDVQLIEIDEITKSGDLKTHKICI